MKKIKFYIIMFTAFSILLGSCEKELLEQTNPNAITTASFWKTEADFERGLNAVYGSQQFEAVSGQGMSWEFCRSDMAGTEAWYPHATFVSLSWTDATEHVQKKWYELYTGIFRANQLLHYIEDVDIPDFTESEISLMKAQAKFIRAINYFWLAHSYGGAVIHTALPFTDDELKKPFFDIPTVMDSVVIPDLEYAYENLPTVWPNTTDLGRITWGAAASMLGKVYLYQEDWSTAATYFKEVIESGIYSLVDDYFDNFTLEGEFNSESIYEVVYSDVHKTGANGGRHDDLLGTAGSEGTSLTRQLASLYAGGWNTVLPTYWLQELFVAGDSMDVSNAVNSGRTFSRRAYATLVLEEGDGLYYNKPLKDDPVTGEQSVANFAYGQGSKVRKWTNWYHKDAEDVSVEGRSGINFRHIRLADIYLMYAEAILERDGDAVINEAVQMIDLVRDRAGVLSLSYYMNLGGNTIPELHKSRYLSEDFQRTSVNVTAASLLTHIRMVERPLELAFEGHRWYDLVRWGMASEVFADRRADEIILQDRLTSNGENLLPDVEKHYPLWIIERVRPDWENASNNYQSNIHDYYPIPSEEFQANKNLNN